MRALSLIAAGGLALSACGDQAATEADSNGSANLASEAIFSNDTTVIDAATGDAANMAADVVFTEMNADGDAGVRTSGGSDRRPSPRRSAPAGSTPTAAEDDTQMETSAETNAL